MKPTCQLIRRPLPKRSPWRKWIRVAAEITGAIITIVLLVALTILAFAL